MTEQEAQRIPRLEHLLKTLNISRKELSRRTGINQSTVSHLLSGYRPISLSRIYQIKQAFPLVNQHWLQFGVGSPFLSDENEGYSDVVSEAITRYESGKGDPLSSLRQLLNEHEQRIAALEAEVKRLKT